jgi:orotate phosphoribosyltransferase
MDTKTLAKKIFELSYLKGNFKLRSGKHSNHYFDKYQFASDGATLKSIAVNLCKKIPAEIEILAGIELGGVIIATALSLESKLPAVFVRKERKEYGTEKIIEGIDVRNKKVILIEDIVTTGGQIITSMDALKNEGAIVKDALCVVYRGKGEPQLLQQAGLQLHWLYTSEDFDA